MNHYFLLDQIATQLYTSAREYDKDFTLIRLIRKDPSINDATVASTLLMRSELQGDNKNDPLIFSVNDTLYYGWVETDENYFLLGPTKFLDASLRPEHAETKLSFTLPDIDPEPLIAVIPNCTLRILARCTADLYNLMASDDMAVISVEELIEKCIISTETDEKTVETFHRMMFENVENSFVHNPFNHEKLEVEYIEQGNVESLRTLLKERFPGRYGTLSDDPIRQEIYLAIVAITLATRAAIRGGVHPETAFYLSDTYIHRIDRCRDATEIIRLTVEAELRCASIVRELKAYSETERGNENENRHISHCKDYIFTHMHGKITVQEIASAIGLETNYLSTLFKKNEKKTLKAYITEEKVKLVKNLLTFSSYSYIEIATYLGFSSQSHMGMEFKKYTGMTPGEYRTKYMREDFIKASVDDLSVI